MKKLMIICCLMFVVFSLSACGYSKVPAGFEGVKINTLGGGKGAITTVDVGRHFYSVKYEMEKFPLFKQNYVWTKNPEEGSRNDESITFQSKESLAFNVDVGISYSVNKGKAADIYIAYHKGIEEITDVDMRNSVRDAFNRLGSSLDVESIYGSGKAAFVASVEEDVREYWGKQGITIHKVYLVGEMEPPPIVKESISKKIQATQIAQQRQNEVKQATAEANKKIEEARGKAESQKLAADATAYETLTEATAEAKGIALIQKQLSNSPKYIDFIKASKWNGVLPTMMMGDAVPMISVN